MGPAPRSETSPPRVVVAGGGVAGVEAALALRALAPHIDVALLSPDDSFTYAPLAPLAALGGEVPLRHDLDSLLRPHGVTVRIAAVDRVDGPSRTVHTRQGEAIGYDRLILALGCRREAAVPGALTFAPEAIAPVAEVLDDLRARRATTLAVVVPSGVSWTLAAYELALVAVRRVPFAMVTVVTAEDAPLQALGSAGAGRINEILTAANIKLARGWKARCFDAGRLLLDPEGSLQVDRTIALPRPTPRPVGGVATDASGWVPVDRFGAAVGMENVYAVGDMTDEPVKHGGLAARQAAAAASAVAASLGADVQPEPYTPVVEAVLFDGAIAASDLTSDLAHPAGRTLGWSVVASGSREKLAAPHLASALQTLPQAHPTVRSGHGSSAADER